MARYKAYLYAQMKMVAVSYEHQILPGWAFPVLPDTFDRWENDIGGVKWNEGDSRRSSSGRR